MLVVQERYEIVERRLEMDGVIPECVVGIE